MPGFHGFKQLTLNDFYIAFGEIITYHSVGIYSDSLICDHRYMYLNKKVNFASLRKILCRPSLYRYIKAQADWRGDCGADCSGDPLSNLGLQLPLTPRWSSKGQGTSIMKSLLPSLDLHSVKFELKFPGFLSKFKYFRKNQGAGGKLKFNVLKDEWHGKQDLVWPQKSCQKISDSCIYFTRRRVLHNLNT